MAKLTRDAFDRMVLDILEDTTALFSLSAFHVSLGRGVGDMVPPIARLEFLRSRITELEAILTAIDMRPLRALASHVELRRIEKVRFLQETQFRRSIRSGKIGRTTTGAYLPREVHATTRVASADVQENRFIRSFVLSLIAWLMAIADKLARTSTGDSDQDTASLRWARRCRQLGARLRRTLDLSTFQEARGRSTLKSPVSPAFSQRTHYRRFQLVYADIQRGLAQVHGEFLEVPLARTFELYELWAYLRLVRASVHRFGTKVTSVSELFEPGKSATGVAMLRKRATVQIGDVALSFQREYHEYWLEKNGLGSFSRTMIPDISFGSSAVSALVVFDAKYRVGSDINDSISSLHMYRDALVKSDPEISRIVAGAYVLTPDGYETAGDWFRFKVPPLLFHPEYRGAFNFGALTLRPGMSLDECGEVLELAFRDSKIPLPSN